MIFPLIGLIEGRRNRSKHNCQVFYDAQTFAKPRLSCGGTLSICAYEDCQDLLTGMHDLVRRTTTGSNVSLDTYINASEWPVNDSVITAIKSTSHWPVNDIDDTVVYRRRRSSAPLKPPPINGGRSPVGCKIVCCCSPGVDCDCMEESNSAPATTTSATSVSLGANVTSSNSFNGESPRYRASVSSIDEPLYLGVTSNNCDEPPWLGSDASPPLRLAPGVPILARLPGGTPNRLKPLETFYPWKFCRCYGCQGGIQSNKQHAQLPIESYDSSRQSLHLIGREALLDVKRLSDETAGWKIVVNRNNLQVLKKEVKNEPIILRSQINLGKISAKSTLALLEQVDTKRHFDGQFDFGYHLQYMSPDLGVIYQAYKGIMGIPGRDFVCVAAVDRMDNDRYVVATRSLGVDVIEALGGDTHRVPKPAGGRTVRGKILVGGFDIKKLSDETVQVTLVTQVDLQAKLPSFIINQVFQSQMASLANLRSVVTESPSHFHPRWDNT